MGIIDVLVTSRVMHFFTNSFLMGSWRIVRGKGNKIINRLKPLMMRSKIYIHGDNNCIEFEQGMYKKTNIHLIGNNNTIHIGANTRLNKAGLWITASNSEIRIGEGGHIVNVEFGVEGDHSGVYLAKGAMVGGHVYLETGINRTDMVRIYAGKMPIHVGEASVLSDGIVIRSTDSHFMINLENGQTINPEAPVDIGANCWICSGALMLKGSGLGDSCIVGARSIVTRDYRGSNNVLLAGSPAKIVRENVTWHL